MSAALWIIACLAACATGAALGLTGVFMRAGLDSRAVSDIAFACGAVLVIAVVLLITVRATGAGA